MVHHTLFFLQLSDGTLFWSKAKSKVKTHADCFNDIIRYAKDNLENICKKAKVEENWEEVVTTMVVSQAETKPKPRKML